MILPGDIVLNEISTGHGNDGWVELLNTTTEPQNMADMQLSDDTVFGYKWVFPDTVIPAGKYLVALVTASPKNGKSIVPISFSPAGGFLMIANSSGLLVDTVSYGRQVSGKSTGRYPNGYGPMTCMIPTKGAYNNIGTTPGGGFLLYPNPARELINLEYSTNADPVYVTLFNSMGNPVLENHYLYGSNLGSSVVQSIDISGLGSGLYLVRVSCDCETNTKKLIVY